MVCWLQEELPHKRAIPTRPAQEGGSSPSLKPTPGMARSGSGATKSDASVGNRTVWSSGLCSPLQSFASIRLQAIPADDLNPASACRKSSSCTLKLEGKGKGTGSASCTQSSLHAILHLESGSRFSCYLAPNHQPCPPHRGFRSEQPRIVKCSGHRNVGSQVHDSVAIFLHDSDLCTPGCSGNTAGASSGGFPATALVTAPLDKGKTLHCFCARGRSIHSRLSLVRCACRPRPSLHLSESA